jgi:hypothetical protein
MTQDELKALIKEANPTVDFKGALGFKGGAYRCDDRDAYQVVFASNITIFASEDITTQTLKNMTKEEAQAVIQSTIDRMVTMKNAVEKLITEWEK